MDETMIGWIFLLSMAFWQSLCNFHLVQKVLHFTRMGKWLQWYTITFIGLLLLLIRTFYDIIKYDYVGYNFLADERITQNIKTICNKEHLNGTACEKLETDLRIPPWLLKISLIAPVCGVVSFVLLSHLMYKLIKYNHFKKTEESAPSEWKATPWMLQKRLQWVITIIGMPMVFNVMAMRSLIRIWAIMTGSCWTLMGRMGINWDQVQNLEMATYTMDLELALTFQFYAVWKFGMLCTNLLEHSKYVRDEDTHGKQYMRTLACASIQGVYAFVVVGILRSIFDFGVAYLQEDPVYKDVVYQITDKVLLKVGVIFTFVTILCMVNMVVVSKVRDIKDNLGNANLKFLGTRLLLLIAQIQPQILSAITVGSPLYKKVREHLGDFNENFQTNFDLWTFNTYQASLAHVALLNIEGLVVVLVTLLFWRLEEKQRMALMADATSQVTNAREATDYRRLPDA